MRSYSGYEHWIQLIVDWNLLELSTFARYVCFDGGSDKFCVTLGVFASRLKGVVGGDAQDGTNLSVTQT